MTNEQATLTFENIKVIFCSSLAAWGCIVADIITVLRLLLKYKYYKQLSIRARKYKDQQSNEGK